MSRRGTNSPWGEVQHSIERGRGMHIVNTASHGGLVLTDRNLAGVIRERFNMRFGITPATLNWTCPNHLGSWSHWEEDCDLPLAVHLLEDLINDSAMVTGWRDSKDYLKILDWTIAKYKEKLG